MEGRSTLWAHSTTQAPPISPSPTATVATNPVVTSSSFSARTPFALLGNVVAQTAVGFGPPLMVTVGFVASMFGLDEPEEEEVMEKGNELPYITPCVEFRKKRK